MPPITVFCAFTRVDMINRWLDNLLSTDLEPSNTNLAFIIDCGLESGGPKIYKRIHDFLNIHQYRNVLIIRNYDHEPNEGHIITRRKRIVEIHEQSKSLIANLDGEFILGLEDDTVFENLSVKRLYSKACLEDTGLVSTYEAGRWFNKLIGIWGFDDIENPTQCWTLLPNSDFEEVDATGWYCYLTRKQYWLDATYHTDIADPYGPDVNFGLYLRKRGLINYVDWEQPTGHNAGDVIILPEGKLHVEHFILDKVWVRQKVVEV